MVDNNRCDLSCIHILVLWNEKAAAGGNIIESSISKLKNRRGRADVSFSSELHVAGLVPLILGYLRLSLTQIHSRLRDENVWNLRPTSSWA